MTTIDDILTFINMINSTSKSLKQEYLYTVKPVLSDHLKID